MSKHDVSHYQTILLLDTTNKDSTNIALISNGQSVVVKKEERAQELQRIISETLLGNNLELNQLDALAVLLGPGSFTGTRIGATAANTLNWLKRTPIILIPGADFDKAVEDLIHGEQFEISDKAVPSYS